jgi:hypothetical protein
MNDNELLARIKAFGMTNQMITEDIQEQLGSE